MARKKTSVAKRRAASIKAWITRKRMAAARALLVVKQKGDDS